MAEFMKEHKKEIVELIVFWIIGFFVVIILPYFVGLAAGLFNSAEYMTKYGFYSGGVFLAGMGVLSGLKIWQMISKGEKAIGIIHDPEQGLLANVSLVKNPLKLFLVSLIFFIPIYMVLGVMLNQTLIEHYVSQTWLPVVEAFPGNVAFVETILDIAIMCIFLTLLLRITKSQGLEDKKKFIVLSLILIPIPMLLFRLGCHLWNYGGVQPALISVSFFTILGVFVTLLTMSIIPWLVAHFLINYADNLLEVMSKQPVMVGGVIVWLLAVFLLLLLLVVKKKKG